MCGKTPVRTSISFQQGKCLLQDSACPLRLVRLQILNVFFLNSSISYTHANTNCKLPFVTMTPEAPFCEFSSIIQNEVFYFFHVLLLS